MSGRYDDIIEMPHPISKKHPQMARADRAAQFSPFAALTGYGDSITETARDTDKRVELSESAKSDLDARLVQLQSVLLTAPEISVTYFVADNKKEGGSYTSRSGNLKKLDIYRRCMLLDDGMAIPLDDIIAIDSPLFREMDY